MNSFDASICQIWPGIPLSRGLLAVSKDTPQDGPFFWAAAFQHFSGYQFPHINKCHSGSKVYTTFLNETREPSTDGALRESRSILFDKESILLRLGKVRANSAHVDVHEFILIWKHWADRWPVLGTLMFRN